MNEPAHREPEHASQPDDPMQLPAGPPVEGPEPWPGFRVGLPAPPPPKPQGPWRTEPPGGRRRHPIRVLVAAAVGLLLLVGGVGLVAVSTNGGAVSTTTQTSNGSRTGNAGGDVSLTQVRQAVVNVNTYQCSIQVPPSRCSSALTPLGAGTGMILTSDGEVLTNNHVVQGAVAIKVQIPGRSQTYAATVLGVSTSQDVALLQIQNVSGLPTVTLADPATVSVGDRVTALGNALGRGGSASVSHGTITALNRSITAHDPTSSAGSEHLTGLIQTDAHIVPGDSGGPLVDASGTVVGMITAGSSTSAGGGSVVGFAIPARTAFDVVSQVRAGNGSSTVLLGERGYLGVAVRTVDPLIAARLGLRDASGALVWAVQPGTPAAQIGMTTPAVIRSIDGTTITSPDGLGNAIHALTPGERMQLTWVDQSGTHTATVTLIGGGPAV